MYALRYLTLFCSSESEPLNGNLSSPISAGLPILSGSGRNRRPCSRLGSEKVLYRRPLTSSRSGDLGEYAGGGPLSMSGVCSVIIC